MVMLDIADCEVLRCCSYHSADLEDCDDISNAFTMIWIFYIHFMVLVCSSAWVVVAATSPDVVAKRNPQFRCEVCLGAKFRGR